MALTINANTFLARRYLTVKDWGVIVMEPGILTSRRKYKFGQIDCVLMSPTHVLSLQVGQQVFQIQTNPGKPRHQQAIGKLLESVARSTQSVGGFPIQPNVQRR